MSELVPDMLSAYLDGELSETERIEVEDRLATSPAWQTELAEARAARDVLRSLPALDAPDGFWAAVHSRVATDDESVHDDERETAVLTPLTARRARPRWGWVAAAAAVVAAIVAVIAVPHRDEVSPNVASVVAQHGAQGSDAGEPVSMLVPVGPLAGLRR